MKKTIQISLTLVLFAAYFTHPVYSNSCLKLASSLEELFGAERGIDSLLMAYRTQNGIVGDGARHNFTGVGNKDVYNPTAPFTIGNKRVIAARVESRSSETDSQVMFFERDGPHSWHPVKNAPVFKLQDPFHSRIGDIHIIGGVETFPNSEETGLTYRTVFYKGRNLNSLRRFAVGPNGMKDIRLAALNNGQIAVFTRPQGEIPGTDINAGPGKIGFTIIEKLSDLTPDRIRDASLISGLFANGEWGGVNEVVPLRNGKLGILMHIARWSQGKGSSTRVRDYYPATFIFDPHNLYATPVQIILERADLPNGLNGAAKRPDLINVLFSGGILRKGDGTATLFVGAGDAEVYSIRIRDPFGNL